MSTAGKLTKNFGALSIIQVANFLIPFLVLPVITRVIGKDNFGLFNFLTAVITYFVILINYGFDYTATRTIARNKDNETVVNEVFSGVFFARLWLLLVSTVLFIVLLFTMPQMRDEAFVSILCFVTCIANVFMPNWLFQGMEQLQKAAIWNVVIKLVCFTAMVIFIREKRDYWVYALFSSLSQLLAGVALFIYAFRRFHIRLLWVPLKKVLQLLHNDRAVFISTLMINLYTNSNIVILGLMKSKSEVGVFAASAKIVSITQMVMLMPLSQTLFPHIGRSFAIARENGVTEVKKIFPLVTTLALGISIALFMGAPVLPLFFGEEFEQSIPVLRIMAIAPFIVSISNLLGTQVLLNLKMDKAFLLMSIAGSVICVGLNMLFTPVWSYYGTALAWVLTEVLITTGMAMIIYRQGLRLLDKQYWNVNWLLAAVGKLKR
ncbi:polysaccharide transporter, PST family [Filimonas lacunae]|uniref:Polysaccharide transporter, PST family n=1 Tax=Filimonas lacunae TaxID=477680 RepID=A0A173MR84_9BACT|nr:flippase [Filimonas lacunae]BAV10162.1 membrane protein [Filimonas lacunae]SIT18708.1 polysaccharide transporter, PST family [Filimonas lacunae]